MQDRSDGEGTITGHHNTQIQSEGDTIAALGNHSIAAGGNVTINNGVDPEVHAEALAKISKLEIELEEFRNKNNMQEEEINAEQVLNSKKELEELVEVSYSLPYLINFSDAAIRKGDYELANRILNEAMKAADKKGYDLLKARIWNGWARLEENMGRYEEAINYSKKAQSIHLKFEDELGYAANLSNEGVSECRSGNYQRGKKLILAAQRIHQMNDNLPGIAFCLNNLGNIEDHHNNLKDALSCYMASYGIKNKIGDVEGAFNSLLNIAKIERKRKKPDEALIYLTKCLEFSETKGLVPFQVDVLNNLGNLYLDEEKYSDASSYYSKALTLNYKIENASGMGLNMQNLGLLAFLEGDNVRAKDWLLKSKYALEEIGSEHLPQTLELLKKID